MLGGDTALHGYRFDHCGLQFGLVSKGVPDPYIYYERKKDATTYSRQACFVNRFTLQGFKRECREYVVASFFSLIIFILLCFNVLSTVPCENRFADFLYIYIYICLSAPNEL